MAVFTSSRVLGSSERLMARACGARDRVSPRIEWTRPAIRMVGLVLVGLGLVLGLADLWVQLARALPVAELLHCPRFMRAMVLTGAGLGLLLIGWRRRACRGGRGPLAKSGVSMAVAAALVAASGAPVLAVDATGTWSGNVHCRQQTGIGIIMKQRRASTLRITQRGEALFMEMDGAAYRGRSEDSPRNPIRARGSAVRCGDDGAQCPPTSEALDLTIKVDEARGTTKLTAASTILGRRLCRYRFGRTSREDPDVGQPAEGASCGDGIVNGCQRGLCRGDTRRAGP